jgi:hypothetical protein
MMISQSGTNQWEVSLAGGLEDFDQLLEYAINSAEN